MKDKVKDKAGTSDKDAETAQLVADVRRDYEERRSRRMPLELQWRLNMNFVAGNQYAEITPLGEVEDYGKQYYWQQREVYNHIASIVETRLSKLSRVKTGIAVRPFSSDTSDVGAARLSSQVLKALSEEIGLVSLLNTAAGWSEVTGTCFLKAVWDCNKGAVIGKDGKTCLREGDVSVSVVPPFELFPDNLLAGNLGECRSLIHAKAYHVDEIYDNWGVRVEGDDVSVFSLAVGYGRGGAGDGVISSAMPDSCIVLERYTLPTAEYPDGRLTIVAGNSLLYDGQLPYVNGADGARGFPFARMICLNKVGSFFGASVVERLIPLQRSYNAVKNRKYEFMNRLAAGVLAIEDGSIDAEELEDGGLPPGKVLIYRQGSAAPRMMDAGNIPPEFRYEEERLLSEFITISGVSELSKYSQTYASMSGKAIALLTEQDDSRLAVASNSMRECIKSISEQMLRLYKQFAGGKRLKRLAGEDGQLQLTCFSASDLQSDDLVFETDNELNDTLSGRRNMLLQLMQLGVLQGEDGRLDERSKSKALEILGFGTWESAADLSECQRNSAIRENMIAGKGKLEVGEVDDHALHIAEHTKGILTRRDGDKGRAELLEHVRAHKAFMAAAGFEAQALAAQDDIDRDKEE
ncbi:MAG: hypothetical protein K2M44_05885 [Clostridia bacterium]|nr:hypothetical protein [Clostridia bacterium]